jgi:hypothetical protein
VIDTDDAKPKIKEDQHDQASQCDQAADAGHEFFYGYRLALIIKHWGGGSIRREITDCIGLRESLLDFPAMTNQSTVDLNEEDKATNQDKNGQERELMLTQSPDFAELKAIH